MSKCSPHAEALRTPFGHTLSKSQVKSPVREVASVRKPKLVAEAFSGPLRGKLGRSLRIGWKPKKLAAEQAGCVTRQRKSQWQHGTTPPDSTCQPVHAIEGFATLIHRSWKSLASVVSQTQFLLWLLIWHLKPPCGRNCSRRPLPHVWCILSSFYFTSMMALHRTSYIEEHQAPSCLVFFL